MKRWICALMAALTIIMMTGCASAEAMMTQEELFFYRGKEALRLLSMGEDKQALEMLDFQFDAGSDFSEEDFLNFVDDSFSLMDSGMVQTQVALCWLDDLGMWHLGIPVVEPVSGDVEVLVLDSYDRISYVGYSVSTWYMLEEAAALSSEAYWNVEYLPGVPLLMTDE